MYLFDSATSLGLHCLKPLRKTRKRQQEIVLEQPVRANEIRLDFTFNTAAPKQNNSESRKRYFRGCVTLAFRYIYIFI